MNEKDMNVLVTVEVPEHGKWCDSTVVRIPTKGLGPKYLNALIADRLLHARDEIVRKAQ